MPLPPSANSRLLYYIFPPHGQRLIGRLYFWSYIYHLTKYYELIDTYIIILRKPAKGLTYLHVLHHTLMMMMVAWWFAADFGAVWIPPLFNSAVHVLMYLYYGMNSLGKRWKLRNYLTGIQILQFITGAVYFVIYLPGRMFFDMNVNGNLVIMSASCCVDLYFFYLFADFYQREYKNKKKSAAQAAATAQQDNAEKGQLSQTDTSSSQTKVEVPKADTTISVPTSLPASLASSP